MLFTCAAMAAHIESEATFEARVRELGLGDVWEAMKAKGLNTYAQFAFGANFTPGQADESQLLSKIIVPLVGTNESRYASVVRLFFEAFTLMSANMKQMIERADDSAPKKLSIAEHEARRERVLQGTKHQWSA